jgi:uncharacterized protein
MLNLYVSLAADGSRDHVRTSAHQFVWLYLPAVLALLPRHKRIALDPYEMARLARATRASVSEFRVRWTFDDDLGSALRQKNDGTCVFLGPEGCEVHDDRPLACRLYPLGRHLRSDGVEHFEIQEGHPLSHGEFTDRGTIADYLEGQGAEPYLVAHDGYFEWLCWASEKLGLRPGLSVANAGEYAQDLDLLDMDSMIAKYCAVTGETEPEHIDDRLQLHLKLLHDVVINLEATNDKENTNTGDDST